MSECLAALVEVHVIGWAAGIALGVGIAIGYAVAVWREWWPK